MKTFSNIKNRIQNYQKEIELLEDSIQKEKNILRTNIIEYWYETKFLKTKLDNGDREYYYLSSFDITDCNNFYGAKINSNGKFEVGKLSLIPIMSAIEYETINADRFFGKLKSSNINIELLHDPIINEINCFKPVVTHCYSDKKNVVGYCRLSQNHKNKNNFDRQISLIRNYVDKSDDYVVSEIFSEVVKGNIQLNKREIISDLIEYCSCNNIRTIVISELNRLGRTQNVILSAISFLNKNNINEIISVKENILINEEYITNHYRQLKSLAKSCEDEYENIKYRMNEGFKAYLEKRNIAIKNGNVNVPALGRQGYIKDKNSYFKSYEKELDLLFKSKMSLRQVNTITGTSLGTLQKIKAMFKDDYIVN